MELQAKKTSSSSRFTLFGERYDKKETLQCYAMMSLQIIGFFVLTVYPILWAIRLAFFYYDGVISNTRFVGLENFVTMFTKDAAYWRTWLTTFEMAIYKLPIELPLAMIVALLLNRNIKGIGFFRGIYYMPCIIGLAIVGVIFYNMFDVFGLVNAWITKVNPEYAADPISWFSNKWSAMFIITAVGVWKTFGTNAIYFTAALSNVPEELYESARLDGASEWTMFWKITVPMIAPVLQMILLLSINGTLHTNEFIITLTNGGPAGLTHTVMSYIVSAYVPGFAQGSVNIGYGCAVSFVTSILMAAIGVAYMKFSNRINSAY